MLESRRRPWGAALLSVLLPGLGHIYSGRPKRGFTHLALLLGAVVASLVIMTELPYVPFNVLQFVIVVPSAYLYVLWDSIGTAKRQGERYRLKAYNKWYVYVLAVLFMSFVVGPVLEGTLRGLFQAFRIAAESMLDTLLIGDHVLVSKYTYGISNPVTKEWLLAFGSPQRGDLIAYHYPEDTRRILLHRVVALPGEKVEIRGRKVRINGVVLEEAYAKWDGPISPTYEFGPVSVPPGCLFVLGDNRAHSMDSRAWGCLPRSNVVGKVKRVYWSVAPGGGRWRWERVGLTVR